MARDAGGPAFPGTRHFDRELYEELRPAEGINRAKEAATFSAPGMTLRDYFAGQTLAGLMANPQHARTFNPKDDGEYCFAIADAMLAARTGKGER